MVYQIERTIVKEIIVDTIQIRLNDDNGYPFVLYYETAILDDKGVIIVDYYDTKEQAIKGHQYWIEKMSKSPDKVYNPDSGQLELVSYIKDENKLLAIYNRTW